MKKLKPFIVLFFIVVSSLYSQNYQVENFSRTFYDANRSYRSITTQIYYPTSNTNTQQTFPVIVLGHGFVMGYSAYENIYNTLVPEGYIVVFVSTEGSVFANHDAYSKDLAYMVDRIGEENTNTSSPLNGLISEERALLGHSMGGGAAIVAASLTNVETLVTFAPAILRVDTETPATQVTAESIVFSGSSDNVTPPDEHHIPLYNNLGSSCKYFISITGGAHCYYANSNAFCDFGENFSSGSITVTRNEQQEITFDFLLPWLDYKLKNNNAAENTFLNQLYTSTDITFENNCTNGITKDSLSSSFDISVGPNPTNSFLNVKSKSNNKINRVELFNQFGKLLISTTKTENIDVSNLDFGTYFLNGYSKNKKITKKVIIK